MGTATHCNTLHHTAKHTATHCNTQEGNGAMKRLITADSWALKSWRSVQCAPTKEVCRMWTECTAPATHLQHTCNTCAYYHEIVALSAVEVCFEDTHTLKDTLQHTCNTPAIHLQHTCNTPATHLQHMCL